jgi:disulfide bond formation protein DsbB
MKRALPTWLAGLAGLVALGIFGASVTLQYVENIWPCPLCIFERFLFLVLGIVLLLLAWPAKKRQGCKLAAACCGAISLAGLCTAAYQSAMQAKPGLLPACSAEHPNLIYRFVDWLAYHINADLFMAMGLCSDKAWTLFGLSLANWAAIAFLGFFAFALWLWRQGKKI